MQSLFKKYRPTSWDQVIGQDRAVKALLHIRDHGGFGGHSFWFAAPSGTGKNTLCNLIAQDFAEPWNIDDIPAIDCTLDYVRDMQRSFAYRGMGSKSGKVWIINEVHCLRSDVVTRLLTVMDNLPAHAVLCFTTTKIAEKVLFEGKIDAHPFTTRCKEVPMSSKGLKEKGARYLQEIAEKEGVNGHDLKYYERIMMDGRNSIRAGLSHIEANLTFSEVD